MTEALFGLAAAGWILAVLLLFLLPARARRKALQNSLRLRAHVRPYLQVRALETKLDLPPAEESQDPDAILEDLCQLSRRLAEHERSQMELGDTMNVAVSDTVPVTKQSLEDAKE
jgi:hypothetical protein